MCLFVKICPRFCWGRITQQWERGQLADRYLEPVSPSGRVRSHSHQQGAGFQLLRSLTWAESDGCAPREPCGQRGEGTRTQTPTSRGPRSGLGWGAVRSWAAGWWEARWGREVAESDVLPRQRAHVLTGPLTGGRPEGFVAVADGPGSPGCPFPRSGARWRPWRRRDRSRHL